MREFGGGQKLITIYHAIPPALACEELTEREKEKKSNGLISGQGKNRRKEVFFVSAALVYAQIERVTDFHPLIGAPFFLLVQWMAARLLPLERRARTSTGSSAVAAQKGSDMRKETGRQATYFIPLSC